MLHHELGRKRSRDGREPGATSGRAKSRSGWIGCLMFARQLLYRKGNNEAWNRLAGNELEVANRPGQRSLTRIKDSWPNAIVLPRVRPCLCSGSVARVTDASSAAFINGPSSKFMTSLLRYISSQ